MGVYNEIGIGRWNRFIQKLTDMKGGPPARQLASEIQFTHDIESGVENRYLQSWDRFSAVITAGPTAAQNSAIQIRNPATSNIIIAIERWTLRSSIAAEIFIGTQAVSALDLTNVFTGFRIDARSQRATGTAILSAGVNVAALPVTIFSASSPVAATDVSLVDADGNQEFSLAPGDSMRVTTTQVNTLLTANFRWRERFLEPAERF
jgi:hypothetical protein